ncbi:MAG: pyridoxamine 5'-phosphate oxidase family protein [Planctomycetota bacterium]|nr:pyridoxamine 5'-phosphate oxidase family protein [Planctomycetota bacterium]
MAQIFTTISDDHSTFIEHQPMFFVATAPEEGRINLSPKGMDTLKVLGPNQIAWLNLTGSGNETASHIGENARMTIMWCSFDSTPMIMRAYGQAKVYHAYDAEFAELSGLWTERHGQRQVFVLEVESLQTSCGFAVPLMDLVAERQVLRDWSDKKGDAGIQEYWRDRNQTTIDGAPTGVLPD